MTRATGRRFERLCGRVTKLFFGGVTRHLPSCARSSVRAPAWPNVVGDQASSPRVMIRTGPILAQIGASLGEG